MLFVNQTRNFSQLVSKDPEMTIFKVSWSIVSTSAEPKRRRRSDENSICSKKVFRLYGLK